MQARPVPVRRTAVDDIFDHLREEIDTLYLRPGDRISEAEIAARFGVSRQPVRDAFTRLANLDLLLIRPQRATEVRRFSLREIEKARFVRAAVEAEVLRRAARSCDGAGHAALADCIDRQRDAIEREDRKAFGALDYTFHEMLCTIAGVGFAFDTIASEKAKVDRLCLLSLTEKDRMPQLLADHEVITDAVVAGNVEDAVTAGMIHLSRLDDTIAAIAETNAEYFEPETGEAASDAKTA